MIGRASSPVLARCGALILALAALGLGAAPASGHRAASDTLLWSALDGKVKCGLANTDIRPNRILCSAGWIPAPKDDGSPGALEGDPGFVYLKPQGGPEPTRISQYTWEDGKRLGNGTVTPLSPSTTWTRAGLGIKCLIGAGFVRCTNRDHRGFVLRRGSYRPIGGRRLLVIPTTRRRAIWRATCAFDHSCSGTATIRSAGRILAKGRYFVRAHGERKVGIPLTEAGREVLAKKGRVRAKLTILDPQTGKSEALTVVLAG